MKKKLTTKKLSTGSAIVIAVLIITAGAIVIAFFTTKSNIDVSCEIQGIEYTDVRPNECWNPEIADEYCPLPTSLSCRFKGDTNTLTLSNILVASLE